MSAPNPKTRRELFERLAELAITTTTVEHRPVFTVAESSRLERELPGGHVKNLFLKDKKDRLYLVVALDDAHIDLKRLPTIIGSARLSFGNGDLLMKVLGVAPGSVTPFALINDRDQLVTVVLDEAMLKHNLLNCHPLENAATTNVARDDLLRFIRACGHEPLICDLSQASGGNEA